MYQNYTDFIDKFGARISGSVNLEEAIDYMIQLSAKNGMKNVFTEEVDVPHWIRGEEKAKMLQPQNKTIGILGLGYSVSTPLEGITAEVVVVKSFEELDSLPSKKVTGKIVIFNPIFISYGETVKYRSQGAFRAAQKGAVASLIRSVTPFSLYTLHTGQQTYNPNVTAIPTASITVEDADLMERMYLRKQEIILHIEMSSVLKRSISRNTFIDLKGEIQPDKLVLVSGHIDSWDVGQGAIDDGGGMFISWFVPIALKRLGIKPRRTIRAALWTAEELGLIGSAAYLRKHVDELDNIHFILESDEGTFTPLGLDVAGSQKTKCIIAEILKLFSPIDKMRTSKYPGSDMSQFVAKGVPGASLLNQNERYFYYHHSNADSLDAQNMTAVVECAAFWTAVSYVIADISEDFPKY
ncbi:peptidase family m28 domain-containing protein [Phthorimaea operculella]|nr:peptidase family m28 domain-containing protein [Phthorimaea operculella]